MASLRDRLTGHFLPRPAQAAEAVEAQEAVDVVEELGELDDPPLLGASLGALFAQISEARAERVELLRGGNVAGVLECDDEIARLKVAIETAEAQHAAADEARARREGDQRRRGWEALRPRLEAAQTERDELAYELWCAVDRAAAVEGEALAMSVTIASPTPSDGPLTRYLWKIWAENHARRVGLMPRAA